MLASFATVATLLFGFAPLVQSVAVWGQCGGINYTGSTTCDAGSTCTELNPYYFQCLPSSSTTSSTVHTTSTTAHTTTTTVHTTTTTAHTTTTTLHTTSTTSHTTTAGNTAPTGTKYWFSFGDSYTQTQFVLTGTLPSPSNPLGNPPYPGYTACGSGANWIDLVTTTYNVGTVLTYNFAYGGATIDATLVTPYEPTVLSMTDQVNQFLNSVASKPATTPWTSANAIFSFFIGINDIGNSYGNGGDRGAFDNTLLDAYFALVQKVYNVGGRNFLFVNVPPINRSPLMLAQSTSAQSTEKTVLADFNSKLATRASSFQSSNSGVKTWVYDSNTKINTILNSPTSYGCVDATSYGATNDCWCNNYHISNIVHNVVAQDVSNLIKGGFF